MQYSKTRRQFLSSATRSGAAIALASTFGRTSFADEPLPVIPKGKADRCIFIWLGGGACQIDTFDPKRKGDGKKQAGSYYDAIETAIPGEKVCQHLSRLAPLMDRTAVLRTVN